MGVWMIGTGSISIKPQVDDNLIREYMKFSKEYHPEDEDAEIERIVLLVESGQI